MPTIITGLRPRDLKVGDVVLAHGMRVLIDEEPRPTSHPVDVRGDGTVNRTYAARGLVLNVAELDDPWLVGVTREYAGFPRTPTGEHRWTFQGNDFADNLTVER